MVKRVDRERRREELIKWARSLPELNYGYLFRHHRAKLMQILRYFAEENEDPARDVAKIYERFLKKLGVEPAQVRKLRPFKSKEQVKKEILELVSDRPRRLRDLRYHYGTGKRKAFEGIAGAPLVRKALRELEQEGRIKLTRVSRWVYVHKPRDAPLVQKIAERWALHQREKRKRALREYRQRRKQPKPRRPKA